MTRVAFSLTKIVEIVDVRLTEVMVRFGGGRSPAVARRGVAAAVTDSTAKPGQIRSRLTFVLQWSRQIYNKIHFIYFWFKVLIEKDPRLVLAMSKM